jgi:O-antigen/teichoic acid export membrane protein
VADIAHRTARAAVWSLSATVATRLISLISLAVLARLLAPRDFGLLAFALVYITYVETIGDLGSSLALIYWPDRRDDAAQVTFWINCVSGFGWFALTLLLAPTIADFFNSPDGAGIVRLLAWSFPIKYLGNTHDALAQKDLRFGARMIPELGLGISKAVISIALAAAGFGGWSLAWGQLGGLAGWTLLLWIAVPWRPSLRFPKDLLGPMLRYGRGMITVNVLAAVVHHIDLAIVGRMLGATVLGIYQMGSRIPDMSLSVIIWGATKVLFPAFSAVHAAGESLKGAYLQAVRYISLLTIPVAAMLVVTAEPLVLALFGAKWTAAIPILQAMAVYSGLRAIGSPAGDVLKASGRSGLLAWLAVIKAAILIPALIAAATTGSSVMVAVALVAVTAVTTLLNFGVAMVQVRAGVREVGNAIWVSVLGSTLLTIAALLLVRAIDAPPVVALLIVLPAGGAVYLAAVALLDRSALTEVRDKLLPGRAQGDAFVRIGRFLIPSDPKIQRHYIESLSVSHRRRDRILRAFAPGLLLRKGEPVRALEEAMNPAAAEVLRTLTGGAPLRPIVVSDYEGTGRMRVILFLFEEGASEPSAVAKLRPLSGTGASLEGEWEALRTAESFSEELRATIPRPLRYEKSATAEGLLVTHVPGRSAYLEQHDLGGARRAGRHLAAAAEWLALFHNSTRAGSSCAVHGDFWSRNLLMSGSIASGVVDWEHFSASGSPLDDLFHFPLTYGRALRDVAVRRYLQRYARATGRPESIVREWMESYLLLKGGGASRLNRSAFSG